MCFPSYLQFSKFFSLLSFLECLFQGYFQGSRVPLHACKRLRDALIDLQEQLLTAQLQLHIFDKMSGPSQFNSFTSKFYPSLVRGWFPMILHQQLLLLKNYVQEDAILVTLHIYFLLKLGSCCSCVACVKQGSNLMLFEMI